ncbi:tyrosine-type recombinase/integrase [Methylorubrum zatmanii]
MSTPKLEKHENGRYYIHWTEGRRSFRRTTGTADLAAAQRTLGAFLISQTSAESQRKQTVDHHATVEDVWILYLGSLDPNKPSVIRYRSVGRHLVEGLGSLPVVTLKQAHVDRYVRDRATGRIGRKAKTGTIWLELNTLRTAIGYGIRKKLISAADKPDLTFLDPPEARDRWLRVEEARRLFGVIESARDGARLSRLERFVWLAVETAARKAVIERLTWDQVDLEARVIHYHRAGDRRTKKRRPSVPISDSLLPVLQRAYAERTNHYVLDTPRKLNAGLTAAAKRASVPDVTPHVLRHTAATWMARRGVPLFTIAGVLGNTLAMVEKVYAKHCPEALAEAVNRISLGALSCAQPSDSSVLGANLEEAVSDGSNSFAAETV